MLQRLSLSLSIILVLVAIFSCNYKKDENVSKKSSNISLDKDSICRQYNANELISTKYTYELQELFLKKKRRMYVDGFVSDIIYIDSSYWVSLAPDYFASYQPNKTCLVKFQLDSTSIQDFVVNNTNEFGMIKGVFILDVKSMDFKNMQFGNEVEINEFKQDVDYTTDFIANWTSVVVIRGELVKFIASK